MGFTKRFFTAALGLALWASSAWAAPQTIVYLTDIEGKWDKFVEFFDRNPHAKLDSQGRIQLADDVVFVFGGDAVDKGIGSRRIIRTLIDLKKRLKDRVILLAGNRDINKLRLASELTGGPLPAGTPPGAPTNSVPELLKWIFLKTMGAADAFDFRREELALEQNHDPRWVSDKQVTQSFIDDVAPGGDMREYLALCQLIYKNGGTLFVHGAVTNENYGHVPGDSKSYPTLVDWITALNQWYSSQLQEWIDGKSATPGAQPGHGIIAYQAPHPGTRANKESVVYGRYTEMSGAFHLPNAKIAEYLMHGGAFRVVSGHTPYGNTPLVMRAHGVEYIVADNTEVAHPNQVFIQGDKAFIRSQAYLAGEQRMQNIEMEWRLQDRFPYLGSQLLQTAQVVKGWAPDGRWLLHKPEPRGMVTETLATSQEIDRFTLTNFENCEEVFKISRRKDAATYQEVPTPLPVRNNDRVETRVGILYDNSASAMFVRKLRDIPKLRIGTHNSLNLFMNVGSYKRNAKGELEHVPGKDKRQISRDQIRDRIKAIQDMDNDILIQQEIEGTIETMDEHEKYNNEAHEPYLVNGNDERGINIGYLVKKDLPVTVEMRTNRDATWYDPAYERGGERLFSRDLPVMIIRDRNKPKDSYPLLILLGHHGKSKRDRGDADPESNIMRGAQIKGAASIIEILYKEFGDDAPIIFAGDMNTSVNSPEMDPIRDRAKLKDALDVQRYPKPRPEDRVTHTYHPRGGLRQAEQIDAIFVSPSLQDIVEFATVYRYTDEWGVKRIPMTYKERERNPSDHFPVYMEIDFQKLQERAAKHDKQ